MLAREEILPAIGRVPRPLLGHEIKPMLRDLVYESYGNMNEKDRRLKAYEASWARLQHEDPGHALDPVDNQFQQDLDAWLQYHKGMLLGELIPTTLNYLINNPACAELRLFDHILVDEYQDLNKSEQRLVSVLATNAQLAVIGDDDQSIYSFKYAHPEGIRAFPAEQSGCEVVAFGECMRCPTELVGLASNLISRNSDRTLGALAPRTGNDPGDIKIVQWPTMEEEVQGIAQVVVKHLAGGHINEGDVLILTPRRHIGYQIRNNLKAAGINVKSYFREEALDTEDARYRYSLFNLLAVPEDRVALRYLLGVGSTDCRQAAYNRLWQKANEVGVSVRDILDRIIAGQITLAHTSQIAAAYKRILEEITLLRDNVHDNPSEIVNIIAPEGVEHLETLREALEDAIDTAGANSDDVGFDAWIGKVYKEIRDQISMPEAPDTVDHVRVMSLHASKGLSAKLVIIASCIEGFIPREITETDEGVRLRTLEEARRLFYVAITRCKNHPGDYPGTLILSSFVRVSGLDAVQMGLPARVDQMRTCRASRFIQELGPGRPTPILGSQYLFSL
jgi:superfamily I DNA/RNA helicase